MVRPAALGLQLVDEIVDRGSIKLRVPQLITCDALQLSGVECNGVSPKIVNIGICGVVRVRYRRVRLRDHRRPCRDVLFIDVLNDVLQLELNTSRYEARLKTVQGGLELARTFAIVLIMKL